VVVVSLKKTDEDYILHHRLCRGGQDHQPSQADICRRETTTAAYGLAGILDGLRDSNRLSFMIFSLIREERSGCFQPVF